MATYIVRKISKKSKIDFYTIEKPFFFDFFTKKLYKLSTFKEALDKAFSLKNCKNIITK
ncbi:hypothetical protein [Sphingobacterium kyonggiense]